MNYSHNHSSGLDIVGTGILLAFGFLLFKLVLLGVVVFMVLAWIATENLSVVPRRLIRGSIIALTVCFGLFLLALLS